MKTIETSNKELANELNRSRFAPTEPAPCIPLHRINGSNYCKMLDVLRMIHHEMEETDDPVMLRVLSRMKMRLVQNDIISTVFGKSTDNDSIPGRYAVVRKPKHGEFYQYFVCVAKDGTQVFHTHPDKAKMYVTYKSAEAAAEFMDDECYVMDMHEFLTEADRFRRALYIPYDADDGNENAIVPGFIS